MKKLPRFDMIKSPHFSNFGYQRQNVYYPEDLSCSSVSETRTSEGNFSSICSCCYCHCRRSPKEKEKILCTENYSSDIQQETVKKQETFNWKKALDSNTVWRSKASPTIPLEGINQILQSCEDSFNQVCSYSAISSQNHQDIEKEDKAEMEDVVNKISVQNGNFVNHNEVINFSLQQQSFYDQEHANYFGNNNHTFQPHHHLQQTTYFQQNNFEMVPNTGISPGQSSIDSGYSDHQMTFPMTERPEFISMNSCYEIQSNQHWDEQMLDLNQRTPMSSTDDSLASQGSNSAQSPDDELNEIFQFLCHNPSSNINSDVNLCHGCGTFVEDQSNEENSLRTLCANCGEQLQMEKGNEQ